MGSSIKQVMCKKVECPYCKWKQQTMRKFGEKVKCPYCNKKFKLNRENYICKVNHITKAGIKRGEYI